MHNIKRVITYIDGFNLYHAIVNLKKNYLKWVDLWGLSERYLKKPEQKLTKVKYFSAFATWKPGSYARHRAYVSALESRNVEFVKGRFKGKNRFCKTCKNSYLAHEEKETDVNLALHILNDAYLNAYDQALLMTADSDLSPAIKTVKKLFPQKMIYIAHPPKSNVPKELLRSTGGYKFCKEIRESHIAQNLLPERIRLKRNGKIVVRPVEYRPIDIIKSN